MKYAHVLCRVEVEKGMHIQDIYLLKLLSFKIVSVKVQPTTSSANCNIQVLNASSSPYLLFLLRCCCCLICLCCNENNAAHFVGVCVAVIGKDKETYIAQTSTPINAASGIICRRMMMREGTMKL